MTDVFQKLERPAPTPPVEVRPKKLSVTRIELWRRNPYAIYAGYILGLFPLNPLESPVKSLVFGNLIHGILQEFFTENAKSTDINTLIKIGKKQFAESDLSEGDKTFLWPKFEKIAGFIIKMQEEIVPLLDHTLSEQKASLDLLVDDKPFTLYGKADCIHVFNNGTMDIVDFKTQSATPKIKEVLAGYAPQLTLEGLLAQEGGFGVKHPKITDLAYWKLSGKDQGGEVISIDKTADEIKKLISEAQQGLIEIIRAFNDPNTPYEVCPVPTKAPTYNDYEHLSRSKEWGMTEENEEEA